MSFGGDSASSAVFSEITLRICCFPTCSRPASDFGGGADALNTEDPAGVGLNLLSPLLFSTERVYPPSLRGHRARCPFGLQIRAGRGSCGSRSAQRCVSDELFPGLCLPGCPLRVTVCVMVRACCSCRLLWGTSEVLKNRKAKHE